MRRQIAWLVVATSSTIVVCFVIPLCLLVQALAQARAQADADREARDVAIVVTGQYSPDETDLLRKSVRKVDLGIPRSKTRVLLPNGLWIGGAAPELNGRMQAELDRARDGKGTISTDSDGVRVLLPISVQDEGNAVVRSFMPMAEVRRGVAKAWVTIIGLSALLLASALGLAFWLGRRVSRPLLGAADVAHELREGNLRARATVAGTPETQELARALNGLAERTEELLAAERASVADLSHRLRTPVTALRLDAEAVPDEEVSGRLQSHIAALQRTIDAIVREARRPVQSDLAAVCDATTVVTNRVRFWAPLAEDQGRHMRLNLPNGPLPVPVAAGDLADVVDIMIDNVFDHTPEGTTFEVRLGWATDRVLLTVHDAGPGPKGNLRPGDTPVTSKPREVGSTGLGLDIARRTATGCGGSLISGPGPLGGTRVDVRLPLVTAE
ncbi:MAG: sensor histidine kinase [Nocardioides sp.]